MLHFGKDILKVTQQLLLLVVVAGVALLL